VKQFAGFTLWGVLMSTSDKLLIAAAALATAFTATTLAGGVFAADVPVKAPAPAPAPFFLVNDTSVSFTWYANATDPGVSGGSDVINGGFPNQGNSFSKYVASATHFDVWAYGTNFFNIDYIRSDNHDPIRGIAGAAGSAEVYAFGRSTISGNALTHSKIFSTWLTKDISIEFGGDVNTQNNALSPEVRKIDIGASFTLNLPGTVVLGVVAQKEWSHNQFETVFVGGFQGAAQNFGGATLFTGDRDFKWIPRLELLISEPLTFLPWPITWNGFTGVNFPKGTGFSSANVAAVGVVPGSIDQWHLQTAETKVEIFEDNRLTLDISKLWWGKPGIWDGYVGYRYWYNKFGTDHSKALFASVGCTTPGSPGLAAGGTCAPGTSIESTVYIGTTYHFK
jgi:hypothetical protein